MSRKLDYVKLQSKLKPETWASVQSFRTRHAQLQKTLNELKDSSAEINFDAYKVLKNQQVVEEAKRALSSQKILKFHSEKQLQEIEKARQAAVSLAKKTEQSIQAEMSELKVLQKDIEEARPIEELTVDDVAKAYPSLDKTVEKMALRGQWRVPGYYEKYFVYLMLGLVNLKWVSKTV
jgi:F-type H+-transporting ATPase subunit d